MELFKFLFGYMIFGLWLGLSANLYRAAFRLSTESINSPNLLLRCYYRHASFCLCFFFSFFMISPLTTWQLIKLPAVQTFGRNHSWFIFAISLPPAIILYWLSLKYVGWGDAKKIRARQMLYKKWSQKRG